MALDTLKHLSPKQIWKEEIKPVKILVIKISERSFQEVSRHIACAPGKILCITSLVFAIGNFKLNPKDHTSNSCHSEQNISSTITEESLQNYLEIVTGEDLTSLYFYPDPAVTSICLAVFKNEVADIEEVQKKAQKRPLEKTVLELLPLGIISGLLLSNISGPVGDDGLTFYFESKKCGSQGANVMDCKQLMDLNIVIIRMTASPEVFKKIVNKLDHQTAGVTFVVEPYYSTFHDTVLNAMQERDIKAVRSNNKPTGIATPKPAAPPKPPSTRPLNPESPATLSPYLKPTGLQINSARGEGGPRRKEIQNRIPSSQYGRGSENYVKLSKNMDDEIVSDSTASLKSKEKLQFASSSCDANPYSTRPQTLPDSNMFPIPDTRQPQAYKNDQQESSSGGLQIFTNSPHHFSISPAVSKPSDSHSGYSSVPDVHPSEKIHEKYTKVAESSDHSRSRLSAKKSRFSAAHSRRQDQGDVEGQSKMDAEHEFETVPMTLEDILLLIIDSFQKKCTFCKIIFNTRQEEVRLSGQKSDVQRAKVMMYKTLERKQEMISSSQVTELHQKLLVLQKTKDAVRTILKSKGIYAIVLMKEDNHLHSYALNYHKAKIGLDLIEQSLVQSTVSLMEGQYMLLAGSEWTSLIHGIEQRNIIKIEQDTKKVEIGGLDQVAVDQAKNEIITFLKNKKPPNTFKQIIDGALARYFKAELADSTRDKVKNSGGSLKMQELPPQSGSERFQVEVEVIGSDTAVEAFKAALKSIWHERLNLYNLCSAEDDLELVQAALSRKGKDITKSFEGRHHCYIDLTLPAGKFEIAIKHPAPKGNRIKVDSPAVHHDKLSDNSSPEFHKKQKIPSPSRDQRDLERHMYKRTDSEPNLFHMSPMQEYMLPVQPKPSPHARFDLNRQETNNETSILKNFASHGYQRRPHSPLFGRREHRYNHEDVLLLLPRAMHRNASEQNITLEGKEEKSPDLKKEIKVGPVSIVVKQGDITKEQAYALLNIVPPSRDLSKESVISQSFVRAGGPELVQMYNNNIQSEEDGFVLTEGAGDLKCDIVLHVMLRTRVDDTEREVRKVMTTCFQKCEMYGVTTLALPPIGCGRLHGYKENSVVEAMLEETFKLALGTPGQMRKVTIVVYDQDMCQKFFKKLSSLEIHAVPSLQLYPGVLDVTKVGHEKKDFVKKPNIPDWKADANRDSYLYDVDGDSKNTSLLHSESSPAILHDQSQHHKQSIHSSEQERERTARNAFKSRTSKESAVTVKVFSKDKQACLDCVKNLAKEMKENYLFESEPINKKHKLPPDDKMKIIDILSKHKTSVKRRKVNRDAYILKGWKEEVYAAHNAILKVLFESSETTRHRKSQHKRPSPDFWMSKTFEQPETPEYWSVGSNVIQDIISKFLGELSGKKCKLANVATATSQEIEKLVYDTWQSQLVGKGSDAVNLRHTRIKVLKVTRVENLDLFDLYFKKRQEIFKSLWKSKQESFPQLDKIKGCSDGYIKTSRGGKCLSREMYPEINEYYFFHGTKVDKIDAICENGLDCRLGSDKGMLGAGIYGAESFTKADQYTDSKQARTPGEKKMFLMRMVLGNIYMCTDSNPHKYRRPPCGTCYQDDCANSRHTQGYFDSVVGDMKKLFREFVVYDKNQCYPEYIITYARV